MLSIKDKGDCKFLDGTLHKNFWTRFFKTNSIICQRFVNILVSQICQYFLLKKCEKLLQSKSCPHFSNKKISVSVAIKL